MMACEPDTSAPKTQPWWDLTRYSIAQRIVGLATILFGVLVVSGIFFVNDLRQTAERTESTKIKISTQVSASAAHAEFGNLRYWLTDLSVSMLMISEQKADNAWQRFKARIDEISSYAPDVASQAMQGAELYRSKALKAADAFTEGRRVIGNAILAQARTHSDEVDTALDDLVVRLKAELIADQSATVQQARQSQRNAIIAIGAILGLGSLLTLMVVRSIIGPLRRVDEGMSAVSAGHFDIEIPKESGNEIGRMAGTLRLLRDKQAELEHARAEAEAANKTKSQFLASMSHELRTPLNAIIGYSEMLSEDAQDAGQSEMIPDLERILSAGRHLLSLINDILDLSKIEAGKMELFVEDFDLEPLLKDVSDTVKPLMDRNSNQFTLALEATNGPMTTDQTKLRQVLFNLLSNAAKFTENGTISLHVTSRHRDGREWIDFAVADTGIGLSKEQLGRLFQAFTQAEASTSRKYGGTGLGLALSRHYCELMGGAISVQSEPGKGSTFHVSLPRNCGADARPQPTATRNTTGSKARVLVVDDDAAVRRSIVQAVEAEGYLTAQARDGRECMDIVRTFRPDAIVLDIIMPQLDGWNVLSDLKKDPELCGIPVILASVLGDKEMGFVFGAVEYLLKPIDQGELVSAIHSACHVGGPRDILLVDDDQSARDLLRRTLSKLGWRIFEASDGNKALEQMARQKPALVLLDLMMPGKNGFEVFEAMQADLRLKDVPVIILTSKTLDANEIDWLNRYSAVLVHKGFDRRPDLIAAIKRHLEHGTGELDHPNPIERQLT